MTFTTRMRGRAAVLLERLGSSGTYTSTTGVRTSVTAVVRHEHNPEPDGFESVIRRKWIYVDLLTEEIGPGANITRGDVLSFDDASYTVDRLESDDGVRLRLIVTEDAA